MGNAVLFSIGQAFRACGSRVLYFAGYKKVIDRYKIDEIEAAADVVVWLLRRGALDLRRAACRTALRWATSCRRSKPTRPGVWARSRSAPRKQTAIIAIGSDRMMAGVGQGAPRRAQAAPEAEPLRRSIDQLADAVHDEGDLRPVPAGAPGCRAPARHPWCFSCFNQDQPLDSVDFGSLNERLKQNALQEKVTTQWLEHCARQLD